MGFIDGSGVGVDMRIISRVYGVKVVGVKTHEFENYRVEGYSQNFESLESAIEFVTRVQRQGRGMTTKVTRVQR